MSTHTKVCPIKFRTRSETITHFFFFLNCRTSEKLECVCVCVCACVHAHVHTCGYHMNPKGAGILVSFSHRCAPSAQSSGWHICVAGMNKWTRENHYLSQYWQNILNQGTMCVNRIQQCLKLCNCAHSILKLECFMRTFNMRMDICMLGEKSLKPRQDSIHKCSI